MACCLCIAGCPSEAEKLNSSYVPCASASSQSRKCYHVCTRSAPPVCTSYSRRVTAMSRSVSDEVIEGNPTVLPCKILSQLIPIWRTSEVEGVFFSHMV
jgi:hypothetical protein